MSSTALNTKMRARLNAMPDLVISELEAMIAGMAALRSTYFGVEQPSREAIVEELVQALLHGFLHRHDA